MGQITVATMDFNTGKVLKKKHVPQAQLSAECWSVQFWGLAYCKTCPFKGKKDCGGKKIRRTGKNELGFKVGQKGLGVDLSGKSSPCKCSRSPAES
jgi:hypothetical protein